MADPGFPRGLQLCANLLFCNFVGWKLSEKERICTERWAHLPALTVGSATVLVLSVFGVKRMCKQISLLFVTFYKHVQNNTKQLQILWDLRKANRIYLIVNCNRRFQFGTQSFIMLGRISYFYVIGDIKKLCLNFSYDQIKQFAEWIMF